MGVRAGALFPDEDDMMLKADEGVEDATSLSSPFSFAVCGNRSGSYPPRDSVVAEARCKGRQSTEIIDGSEGSLSRGAKRGRADDSDISLYECFSSKRIAILPFIETHNGQGIWRGYELKVW